MAHEYLASQQAAQKQILQMKVKVDIDDNKEQFDEELAQ